MTRIVHQKTTTTTQMKHKACFLALLPASSSSMQFCCQRSASCGHGWQVCCGAHLYSSCKRRCFLFQLADALPCHGAFLNQFRSSFFPPFLVSLLFFFFTLSPFRSTVYKARAVLLVLHYTATSCHSLFLCKGVAVHAFLVEEE